MTSIELSRREVIQWNVFTRWCNYHLGQVNKKIVLLRDFSNGLKLIDLLRVLSGSKLQGYYRHPVLKKLKIGNVSFALAFLKKEKISVQDLDSRAIVGGNMSQISELIWRLICFYSFSHLRMDVDEDAENVLHEWIQSMVFQLPIYDFSSSWNDGIALGALINNIQPGLCPRWPEWNPHKKLVNVKNALDIAEKKLGIAQLIKAEELIHPSVDERSVITYLQQFLIFLKPQVDDEVAGSFHLSRAETPEGTLRKAEEFFKSASSFKYRDVIGTNFTETVMEEIFQKADLDRDEPTTSNCIFYIGNVDSKKDLSKDFEEVNIVADTHRAISSEEILLDDSSVSKSDNTTEKTPNQKQPKAGACNDEAIFFRDSNTSKYYKTEIQKRLGRKESIEKAKWKKAKSLDSSIATEHIDSSSASSNVFHFDDLDLSQLEATIESLTGSKQNCTLKKLTNGDLGVSFIQPELGEHLLSVKKNGEHLNNSPFQIMIRQTNSPHKNGYHVTTRQSSKQQKTSKNVLPKDQNPNFDFSQKVHAKSFQVIKNKDSTFSILYEPLCDRESFPDGVHRLEAANAQKTSLEQNKNRLPSETNQNEAFAAKTPSNRSNVTAISSIETNNTTLDTPAAAMETSRTEFAGVSENCEVNSIRASSNENVESEDSATQNAPNKDVIVQRCKPEDFNDANPTSNDFQQQIEPILTSDLILLKELQLFRDDQTQISKEFHINIEENDLALLSVKITAPSEKEEIGVLKKRSDGNVGLLFIPKELGKHKISVLKNGEHIKSSPFEIVVDDLYGDASRVRVYGNGCLFAISEKTAEFFVDVQHAGHGKLEFSMEGPSKVEMRCDSMEKGIHKVSYKTQTPGTYNLEVKFSGKDIPGSPFVLISKA